MTSRMETEIPLNLFYSVHSIYISDLSSRKRVGKWFIYPFNFLKCLALVNGVSLKKKLLIIRSMQKREISDYQMDGVWSAHGSQLSGNGRKIDPAVPQLGRKNLNTVKKAHEELFIFGNRSILYVNVTNVAK